MMSLNIKTLLCAALLTSSGCVFATQHTTVCEQGILYVVTYETIHSIHTAYPVWGEKAVVHCDGSQYTLNGEKLTKDEVSNLVASLLKLIPK